MSATKKEIAAFWNWFASASDQIESLIAKSAVTDLREMFDARVRAMSANIGWEVGPGIARPYALSFGLRQDLGNLTITKAIVAAAPHIQQWEFLAAKPPKNWDLRFVLLDPTGRPFEVDARSWRYSLTSFGGHAFFDIAIIASNLPPSKGLREQAACVLLLGGLGEIDFLRLIDRITVVQSATELDPVQVGELTDMSQLREHLSTLTALTPLDAYAARRGA